MTSPDESPLHCAKNVILNGCAWPKPFEEQLESYRDRMNRQKSVVEEGNDSLEKESPMLLHVVGATDTVNPPEQGRRVCNSFGEDCSELFEHELGHVVPCSPEAIRRYRDFLIASGVLAGPPMS
mmetsp:Transcript_13261/g.18378  ORF Transcript_13261/g.18378 Transcript_13261/m.18378 type:complete len:124 (-) Transcript_13261:104-475(-)